MEVTFALGEEKRFPPDAQADVQLLDVSLMDVAATGISAKRVADKEVPMKTQLVYDPEVIDERMRYAVSVRIYSGRDLLFRTTSQYPVLTQGGGTEASVFLDSMN